MTMAFCGINVMLNIIVQCLLCFMFPWVGKNLRENFGALDHFSPSLMDLFRKKKGPLARFWLSFYIRQRCVDLCSPLLSSPLLSLPLLSSALLFPFLSILKSPDFLSSPDLFALLSLFNCSSSIPHPSVLCLSCHVMLQNCVLYAHYPLGH